MPNTAAVPAALTRKRIRREYLRVAGVAARGGVGRVVLRGCVECGVGLVNATLARTRDPWGELAAPITPPNGRENTEVAYRFAMCIMRGAWRATPAMAVADAAFTGRLHFLIEAAS